MSNESSSFLSSSLPSEAALLGFASSSLADYMADDEHGDDLDPFDGRPVNASINFSTALRGLQTADGRRNGGGIMQEVAVRYLFRCMARQGVTLRRLLDRGVDREIVEALAVVYLDIQE